MPALKKMYNSLTEQQRAQVYDFVLSFYKQNSTEKFDDKEIVDAFGMWKDRDDIKDVDYFARDLRKGRKFDN